jgi:hypothetical protein
VDRPARCLDLLVLRPRRELVDAGRGFHHRHHRDALDRAGKVDVVYYGTDAASHDDPNAVWNVYDSQLSSGIWTVGK